MLGAKIDLRDKSCVLEIRAVNRWLQFRAVNFRVIMRGLIYVLQGLIYCIDFKKQYGSVSLDKYVQVVPWIRSQKSATIRSGSVF